MNRMLTLRTPPLVRPWSRLGACVVLLLAAPAWAQPAVTEGRGEASAEAPAEGAAATAIPLERIPERIEQGREQARRASELARPSAEIEAVRQQLGALQEQVAAFGENGLRATLARLDLRSLESEMEQVTALRRTVLGAQATLGRRAAELTAARDAISLTLRSWQLTEEALAGRQVPAEIVSSVRNIKAILGESVEHLSERLEDTLALQGSLAGWISGIDDRSAQIEAQLATARVELFRPEHPPIWRGESATLGFEASRESWRRDWQTLLSYLQARSGHGWVYAGLLVFLLGGFVALSRKVGQWIEDKPDLEQPLAIFRQPLAAAVLLAILCGPWIYPDAPIVLRELQGIIIVLPLLLVLPLIVAPSLRGAMYLLAGLYLLLLLNSLLGGGTALERYTLLVLSGSSIAAVAWIFRPGGAGARLEAGPWWRLAQLVARGSIFVLLAALLANVGGLVSLAGLLTAGVIGSAFIAMVLFAGVVVTRGTVLALFQTRYAQKLNLVRWHGAAVDHWLMRILPLLALLAWAVSTARLFRIDGVFGQALSALLFSSATIGTVEISLGDILGFGIAIWLGVLISRFLRFVLSVDIFPRVTLPRGVAATISMLVNYLVLGIAFVLAVAAAGIQLDRFALIVGALSVGIGFGLQNIVNNFVSGLILAFERPVQAGDTVQFSSMFGKVTRIGVRSSTVRTFDGAEVIVPNGNLISNEVTNWTLSDYRRRIEILVGVAYGSNPRQVMELLLNCARGDERVMDNPGPSALFLGFGDSSLDFSLRAWTERFDEFLTIKSDLTLAVHDALYGAGVEIPFPQRDLHLRSVDPQAVARIGAVQAPPVGDGEVGPGEAATPAEPREPAPGSGQP